MYTVILYYKYIPLENPKALMREQRRVCENLSLKGRILIAEEGINGTLEGKTEDIEAYCKAFLSDSRFSDVIIKKSTGTGNAFSKLQIKVREEIVSSHLKEHDVKPYELTGKYITAEELHEWFEKKREFYIIDMRNNFEHISGHFEGSILPNIDNFRNLPDILPELKHLKNKTIVTVCTGGVRCEKASGYLLKSGFADVYQLKDGIVTYMEKYPNEHFKGKLYVFDKRFLMGFNTSSKQHEIIGRCAKCGAVSENYINCIDDICHRHFICCKDCVNENNQAYCPQGCRSSDSSANL
jgi:UPF0176 protein